MEQKPLSPKAKNVRCTKCNKWIRIPGWVKTKLSDGKTYKDAIIKCPHCKAYNEIVIKF